MKKVAYLSIVLILLAVLAVPAMAKSPQNNGKGNGANAGHGNGVSSGESSTGQIPANQGQGNQANHQNRSNRGNNGVKDGNQGRNHPNTPFYLQGTITEIMSGTETISVTLTHGNAMVKQFIGLDLTIKATEATQIFKITQGTDDEAGVGESTTPELSSSESETSDEGESSRVAIPFDQLAVGQKVAIHGNLVDGVYTARLITEYLQTPVGESTGEQP